MRGGPGAARRVVFIGSLHAGCALALALAASACCGGGDPRTTPAPGSHTAAGSTAAGEPTPTSPHAGAAPTATMAPTAAATGATRPASSDRPPWAPWGFPQAKNPGGFRARGLKGPVPGGFEGLLVCQYVVTQPRGWDPVIPFVDSASTRPDVIATLGKSDKTARGETDSPTGYLTFAAVRLEPAGSLAMKIEDEDETSNDLMDSVTLDASKGFPMQAKGANVEVTCLGLPVASLQADIATREAAATRAVDAMEKMRLASPTADVATLRPGTDAAEAAVLDLVSLTGFTRPSARALCDRVTSYEGALGARSLEALLAAASQGGDAAGWRSLPSARVRPDTARPGHFQMVVGPAGATYDWRTHHIGAITLHGVTPTGERLDPPFVNFVVDGTKLEGLDLQLPPGKTIDVEISPRGMAPWRAIVLDEGARQVVLASKP